jgi:CBS domain containing-hemolysin-like protein
MTAICAVGQAFFAGIETGVISIDNLRLRHAVRKKVQGARLLYRYARHTDRLLGTTLVGTNICMVTMSVLATDQLVRLLGSWGELASTVFMSGFVLLFCEYLPKNWFRTRPLERSRRYVRVLRAGEVVLRPVALLVVWLTRGLVPGPRKSFAEPGHSVSREDLKDLAQEGEKQGVLSSRERVMIHRVFELSGKRADEIMIPLDKATVVESTLTVSGFLDVARKTGFTRYPVRDPRSGQFCGVINLFFVLSGAQGEDGKTVGEYARPPLFIPQDMPVDDIFPKLRRFHQPMALVQDAGQRAVGLITTEDILEEIVGEF